ncbi:MAG: hypothetical protein HYX47_23810 [Burkholderiales bacterium]|nr:hypothetical protein [Burkholderiales bacterium]
MTHPVSRQGPAAALFYGLLATTVVVFGVVFDQMAQVTPPHALPNAVVQARADLTQVRASPEATFVAQWIVDSRDNAGLPFLIVDKAQARLYAFDAAGRLRADSPVLLGAARGDDAAVPLTPAGRFVAGPAVAAASGSIVWANRQAAVALHGSSVALASAPGHSAQRLASGEARDKRISDGSLHVDRDFFRSHLQALGAAASVAYVLPEVRSAREVFGAYDVEDRVRQFQLAKQRPAAVPGRNG